jgi:hypothetical protein
LSLILIQGKLIDDLPYHIKASLDKIFIDFKSVIGFSKDLIPFLSAEVILGVKIGLQCIVAHKVAAFAGEIVGLATRLG